MRYLRISALVLFALAICAVAHAQSQGSVITAKTFIPSGFAHAAYGNGTSDDTAVLQADINYALLHEQTLDLEPGTYLISAPLVIQLGVGVQQTGFRLSGLGGPNRNGASSLGGVAIELSGYATSASGILEVGHGAFRDMIIENIGLVSKVANNATPYGLLFYGNGFSHVTVNNVAVDYVKTAYAEISDGTTNEANGEFVDLNECSGNYCNNFYRNSFGESYAHHLINCCAGLYSGGTFIEIGSGNLANSLDAFGCSCTFIPGGPVGASTFIKNDGINGDINIWGGRVECVDTVLGYTEGSAQEVGQINIHGVHFTNYTGVYPLINGALYASNAQWTNTIDNCRFDAQVSAWPKLSIAAMAGDHSQTYIDKCVFWGFSNLITNLNLSSMGIVVTHCRANSPANNVMRSLNS
jgi:hypothetical protein